jgi:intracellular sulfur oxidation DsrE/DsrF family protein
MSTNDNPSPLARRSFFARLGAGAAAFGMAMNAGPAGAQAPPATPFVPTKHALDDWFDETTAKHRLFLDTTTVAGIGHAIFWSGNFLNASRSYELADHESAVIIGVRHESTPFSFNDAMWAKYGAALAEHAAYSDPAAAKAPAINLMMSTTVRTLANRGVTIEAVAKRGVRLSVCMLATRAIAGIAARTAGASVDDVYKELIANLAVPGAHMVPAGIVAVNRAQERGYTFNYVA